MSKFLVRSSLILVALLMIRGDFIYLQAMRGAIGDDFWVYYTGAWVVRSGPSTNLYEAADRNIDPSSLFYDPSKPQPILDKKFIEAGRAHGIPIQRIYIYPPTLADLLIPLTFVAAPTALTIWFVLDAVSLIGIGVLLALWSGRISWGRFVGATVITLLCPPTVAALLCGQVTVILLFLLLAGIHLYLRERWLSAAFLFALAASIKLTPLIVIFPLIAWGDWRMVRALSFWCAAIVAAVIAINGWGSLELYFLHEMPKIGSDFTLYNRTLDSLMRELWPRTPSGLRSATAVVMAKLLSLSFIGLAILLSRPTRKGFAYSDAAKFETLAAFFLLSACIAPVSWEVAYVVAMPLLWLWGERALNERPDLIFGWLLLFGISFSTWKFHGLFLLTPITGIAISIASLYRSWRGGRQQREWPIQSCQTMDA